MNDSTTTPVRIFDTTLRDGEQAPGISLDVAEKLEIADQLARLRVDIIEAGFPITSQGDFDGVKAIADDIGTAPDAPVIAALARCHPDDIQRAAEALKGAHRNRIHVFLSTSEIHRHAMLRDASEDEIIEQAVRAVQMAREYTDDVEFSPQDATRTERDFLCAWSTRPCAPARRPSTSPTRSATRAAGVRRLIASRRTYAASGRRSSSACTATTTWAWPWRTRWRRCATAPRQVEVAINGIGERAGNCRPGGGRDGDATRSDLLRRQTDVNTRELARTSRLVSQLTGIRRAVQQGDGRAQRVPHESGIHQDGVLKMRETYEIMRAEDVGVRRRPDRAGQALGPPRVRAAARGAWAISCPRRRSTAPSRASRSWPTARSRSTTATWRRSWPTRPPPTSTTRSSSSGPRCQVAPRPPRTAAVKVRRSSDGNEVSEAAVGDGMVDAVYRAIRGATGIDARLLTFNVQPSPRASTRRAT